MSNFFFKLTIALICIFPLFSKGYTAVSPIDVSALISGNRPLKVGHIDLPPFYFSDEEEAQGMDPSIFREIAKRIGFKNVHFVSLKTLHQLTRALQDGKIDIIACGLGQSKKREETYLLSKPYYLRGGLGLLYPIAKGPFESIDDLKNTRIGIITDSYPQHEWLPEHGFSFDLIKTYDTFQELLQGLKKEEVDVLMTSYTYCAFQKKESNNQLEAKLFLFMPIVYAMRKEDQVLAQKINTALDAMWADGSLYNIKIKYLKPLGIEPSQAY